MPENVIEQALDQVADRAAIDWDALERSLNSADERRWLDCVRVLEDIAKFHFSDGEDGEPAPARAGVADALTIDAGRGAVATPVDISQWWGRYRLDQKVGEGAFGCVYRAWDPELERQVAVKILHKRVAETRLRQALLREGRALARVRIRTWSACWASSRTRIRSRCAWNSCTARRSKTCWLAGR